MENTVSKVTDPFEIEEAQIRMTKIRFNCIVKIYDYGTKQYKSWIPFSPVKYLPPQWFKSEISLSLEFLRDSSPELIGLAIKQALEEMDKSIIRYQNS